MTDNVISLPCVGEARKGYHYGLYFHKVTAPDGTIYTRPLIVLRNSYGDIVRFTGLHRFAEPFSSNICAPLTSGSNEKLYHICATLNYILIEQYEQFNIDHVFDVTWEAVNTFFLRYAYESSANGKFRSRTTIEKCIYNVTDFFRRMKSRFGRLILLEPEELYTEKPSFDRNGRQIMKRIPLFQVKHIPQRSEIFRELPTKAFQILLNLAFRYTTDIAFAICLQAFAGLRAGEVCNVRQEGCPIGNGLIFTHVGAEVSKVEIDITRELPMRSDGVSVGRIKRERRQCVYPPFIQAFRAAYEYHKNWLASHRFEADYRPMFVNSEGFAMTYKNYSYRFEKLIDQHFKRALFRNEDPEMHIYGQLLYENRLGLHALRHWFSVQLVLHGEDIAQIQYWRGDKSPESAFTYLQNKGDLIRELETSSEFLNDILMEEGARFIDK